MSNSSNNREIITIGIELNHVVRNINKQIIKYYIKEFNLNVDMEDIDDKEDIFKDFAKFESKYAKNNFLYIDYPYEVFGCAHTMEKKLSVKITNWLSDIENIEDKDIRIVFYSLDEEALTIQSTYFFLSKIGTRVRTMMFPKSINEVYDKCDVIITARNEFLEKEIPLGKKIVLVNRPFNTEYKGKAFLNYDNLSDIISDNDFFNKIENGKKNSFIVYDLKKITDFIFENQNSRTNDVEITDTLEYDKEKNKMVPKTKEIKEVKVNDDMSQTTIRYDLIKSFIDTLDMSEDMDVMSVGQSITLNTLQSYGMIKEIKM